MTLIIFLVLQLLDGYTTYKIVGGGGTEMNPIMRVGIERIGLVPALVIGKGLAGAAGYVLSITSPTILIAMTALYVVVVLNNIRGMKTWL